MESGYIMLSRKFFKNEMWQAVRIFNDAEAWLDLIQSARYEDSEITSCVGMSKKEVTWGRGQYPASIRFLTKKWGWSIRKVKSFLANLQNEGMISIDDEQGVSIITLCNFDKYNYNSCSGTPNGTPNALIHSAFDTKAEHQTEHLPQKRITNESKNNKDIIILSTQQHRAHTHTCEADFFAELRNSQIWLEDMCMRFHLSPPIVIEYINEFELECKCKDHTPESISDLKSHFHDWLRIQNQKIQNQYERTSNNKGGLSQLSERLRSKLPPKPGCGLIED